MNKTAIKKVSPKQQARTQRLKGIACELLEEQKGLCSDCKQPPDFRGFTLHHRIFRSQGGTDDRDNLELICMRCSDSKHGIVDK